MEAHVEEHHEDPGDNITAGREVLRNLKVQGHNGNASRGAASRPAGREGKRGRGRRVVAPRSLGSLDTQKDIRDRAHGSGLLGSLAHEADFCFNERNAWNGIRVPPNIPCVSKQYTCDSVAALHGLLTPQTAAEAFATGTNLSTEWGDTVVSANDTEVVRAAYEETPEGYFLRTAVQLLPDSTNTLQAEQYAFDVQSLRCDLIPFPLPVRFWRSGGSKCARHQQLRTGICVVPPLTSASPRWSDWGECNPRQEERVYGAAQEDNSRAVEEDSVHEGDGRKSISEADALLNVGGSILAVAVSQECSVAEALDHCRERQAATAADDVLGSSEGFVVLAVSVGPVQRVTAHAPHLTTNVPASGDASRSPTSDSFEANDSGIKGGTLPASCGEREGQPFRQQQRKATGQVQLWTISSNHSVKPRLRVIFQDDGGTFRNLHWISNSQLLLPRCSDALCADGTTEGEKKKDCGCCKGTDCYRSRLGLLCGVNDSGVLSMWSVPLAPFLPEREDGFPRKDILHGVQCGEPGSQRSASEVERRPSKARDPVAEAVEAHMHSGIRCCVLPAVWKFKSPNVRFFCCAAAPGHNAGAFFRDLCWQEPVILVGGAGEGRLYVFAFSAEPPSPQFCSSHVAALASSSGLTLRTRSGIAERPQCSMYVLTPGCHSSEVRRSVVADTAALQVVEGNCGCYRSREIHDLAWCAWSRYLVASAENALVINLLRQQVKQLPLHTLRDSRGGKNSSSGVADGGDRCCWSCTSLGPLFFYTFSGGCLVQGNAASLEQRGQGGAVCWQWSLADADDQKELSRMLEKQPQLVQAQRVAERELKALRRTLLDLLKEQMAGLASSEFTQQTQPQSGLSVDLMQQRVDTLLALQQLEERCELLSRGLVIAEGGALATVPQKGGKRSGEVHVKTSSILALRK
ncbi:hypothetical protein Esti_002172 [Eimeria stiedai]